MYLGGKQETEDISGTILSDVYNIKAAHVVEMEMHIVSVIK